VGNSGALEGVPTEWKSWGTEKDHEVRLPLGRSTGSLWATVRLGLAGGLGPGLGRNGGEGWWATTWRPVGTGVVGVGGGAGAWVGKDWRGGRVGRAGEEDRLE